MKNINETENKVLHARNLLGKGTANSSFSLLVGSGAPEERTQEISQIQDFSPMIVESHCNKPYCLYHNIELEPSFLETKHCIEKNCSYFSIVKKIIKFPSTPQLVNVS